PLVGVAGDVLECQVTAATEAALSLRADGCPAGCARGRREVAFRAGRKEGGHGAASGSLGMGKPSPMPWARQPLPRGDDPGWGPSRSSDHRKTRGRAQKTNPDHAMVR